jgi:hypothetical protein
MACAGCTTPGDVATSPPIAIFLSARPVDAIVTCASPALRAVWPRVRSEPVSEGQRLVAESDAWGAVPATVDIYRSVKGSMVEVRLGPGKSNGIVRLLEPCL